MDLGARNSYKKHPGKSGQNLDLRSGGSGGPFLLQILRKAWLESSVELFHFTFGKPENPSFPWFSDFGTSPWLPQLIIFNFGTTKRLKTFQEKSRIVFEKHLSGNLKNSGQSETLKMFEQTGAETNPKIRLMFFEHLEHGINTHPQKHDFKI